LLEGRALEYFKGKQTKFESDELFNFIFTKDEKGAEILKEKARSGWRLNATEDAKELKLIYTNYYYTSELGVYAFRNSDLK